MEITLENIGLFVLRIGVAIGLGVAIGIERQLGQHPAGMRTNALVCLGAALFVSLTGLLQDKDVTRVAAQVVSGIGFICGGAILREGLSVRGMNTAATLWCSAAIGTLVGANQMVFAAVATACIIGAHVILRPLAHAIDRYAHNQVELELHIDLKIVCVRTEVAAIRAFVVEQIAVAKLRLQGLSLEDVSPEEVQMKISLFALEHDEHAMNDLVSRLAGQGAVSRVSWDKAK